MVICKNCGNETEAGKYCGYCGKPLLETIIEGNKSKQDYSTQQEQHRIPPHERYDSTQQSTYHNPNQNTSYHQGNYRQESYQHQQYSKQGAYNYKNNYNYQQANPVHTQKSQFLGILLSIILPGLGHIYIGKVAEGIVLMAVFILMLLLAFLIVPALIAFAIWIYAIIKTNDMIEKYNSGLSY